MLMTTLSLATTVISLVAAASMWLTRAKSNDRRLRLVLAFCAAAFVAVAITFLTLADWH
jgi:hypothetical protein